MFVTPSYYSSSLLKLWQSYTILLWERDCSTISNVMWWGNYAEQISQSTQSFMCAFVQAVSHYLITVFPAEVAHQFQYAVRVIGSNYAPTIERDEFLVSEKIKKEREWHLDWSPPPLVKAWKQIHCNPLYNTSFSQHDIWSLYITMYSVRQL